MFVQIKRKKLNFARLAAIVISDTKLTESQGLFVSLLHKTEQLLDGALTAQAALS